MKTTFKQFLNEAVSDKMNTKQVAMMAAILGVSNAGSDHLFSLNSLGGRRRGDSWSPDRVKQLYNDRVFGDPVESYVTSFVSGIAENEEMKDMFVNEAKSWVKKLSKMSLNDIKSSWKKYAPYVDAISGDALNESVKDEFEAFKRKVAMDWETKGKEETAKSGDTQSMWIADNYGQEFERFRNELQRAGVKSPAPKI